jgi:hypothetical protein
VKDTVHTVRDALPDSKTVKKTFANAKEHVEDAAKAVKDALPSTKGVSGEPSRKMGDPVFLEEPGEMATAPPIANKRRYGVERRENLIVTCFLSLPSS